MLFLYYVFWCCILSCCTAAFRNLRYLFNNRKKLTHVTSGAVGKNKHNQFRNRPDLFRGWCHTLWPNLALCFIVTYCIFCFLMNVTFCRDTFSFSVPYCLQCFDSVGWAARRAYGRWKTEWLDAGVVMCLGQGADLHMAHYLLLQ